MHVIDETTPAVDPLHRVNTKAAGIVALAVMCSRVLGLIREQVQAALFGGGRVMDAFTIAFRMPNLLRDWAPRSFAFFPTRFNPALIENKHAITLRTAFD